MEIRIGSNTGTAAGGCCKLLDLMMEMRKIVKENGGKADEKISLEELKQMKNRGGLVLQGCSGNLQEWVDGIHKILSDKGILQAGNAFHEVYTFENEGLTCLLFDMQGVNMDMGRLAIWSIAAHETFGGMWLEDYLDNHFGMDLEQETVQKPDCELIGQGENIFNLIGIAARTLRRNGMED